MSTRELLKTNDGVACSYDLDPPHDPPYDSRPRSRQWPWLRFLLHSRARQGLLTLIDQAVTSGTNFLTTVILGRMCLQHELGLYAMGFSLVVMLLAISRALVWMPYTAYSPHLGRRRLAGYTGSVTVHMAAFCLLTALGLGVAALVTGLSAHQAGLAGLLAVLAVAAALMLFREYVRRVYLARMHVWQVLFLDMGLALLQLGGLGLLALWGRLSAQTAYGVVALVCGTVTAGWLLAMRRQMRIRRRPVWIDWRRNWRFARWMVAAALITVAASGTYPWIVACFHGTASVGVLAAAHGVIFFANPLLIGVSNFFGPLAAHTYARNGPLGLARTIQWSTLGLLAAMGMFAAVVSIWGGQFLKLLYGPHYAGHGDVVRALAWAQLTEAAGIPVGFGLLAMDRADYTFKTALVQLAVTFTLGLWCVDRFGPAGVGYAASVGGLAALGIQWLALGRIVRRA